MYGIGVIKGLVVTLKEFIGTYVDDIRRIPSRYAGGRVEIDQKDVLAQTGLFTVQYPEEHRKLPERFRYIPMLVYEAETGEDRCTACGICAKVCPPQCIWIVRDKDEKGKPITRPAEFHIDATICMNCGLCAEFCPFDAIKMNHDFEIAAYERMPNLVFDLKALRVPTTYYARIRPADWAEEEAARKAKEAEKGAKPEKPEAGSSKLEAGTAAAPTAAPAPARTPEEIERLKAEAAARRVAKAGGEAGSSKLEAGAEAAPTAAPAAARTPEEIERLKAEAAARRAAKAGGAEAGRESTPHMSSKLEAGAAPSEAAAPLPAPQAPASSDQLPASSNQLPASSNQLPASSNQQPAPAGARRTPEEIERLKAEAAARRAAKAGGTEA